MYKDQKRSRNFVPALFTDLNLPARFFSAAVFCGVIAALPDAAFPAFPASAPEDSSREDFLASGREKIERHPPSVKIKFKEYRKELSQNLH